MTVTGPAKEDPAFPDRQWLWALLPAFPVLLLALRLWLLSRQNPQTMLLLVQHVSSLGLLSTLALTLIQWVLPAAILTVRALSALDAISEPEADGPVSSRLARAGAWIPDWVLWLAVVIGAVAWQLRFLPALLMVTLMIVGLLVRQRCSGRPVLVLAAGVALPVVAAAVAYPLLAPAIAQSFAAGEALNGLLLLLPPGMAVLLTGPIPARAAQEVIRGAAIGAAVLAPFLAGAFFLRAPVLPTVAMEIDDARLCAVTSAAPEAAITPCVASGQIVTVDDRAAALLRPDGSVLFVPNGAMESQTLCPTAEQAYTTRVRARGWHIEQSALDWMAPRSPPTRPDPRCQGRPLQPLDE